MKAILQQALVLLTFFGVFLLLPEGARSIFPTLGYVLLIVAVLFIISRHWSNFKRGLITRTVAFRKSVWDMLKIILVVLLTTVLGKMAAVYASGLAGSRWEGMGTLAGLLALLITSIVVINGVRWGMDRLGSFLKL